MPLVQGVNTVKKARNAESAVAPYIDSNIVPNVHGTTFSGATTDPVTTGRLIKHVTTGPALSYGPADNIAAIVASVMFSAEACGDAFLVNPCVRCTAHLFVKSEGPISAVPSDWYQWDAVYPQGPPSQTELAVNTLVAGGATNPVQPGYHYLGASSTVLTHHSVQSVGTDRGDVVQTHSCWTGRVDIANTCVPQAVTEDEGEAFVICVCNGDPGETMATSPFGARVFADALLSIYKK